MGQTDRGIEGGMNPHEVNVAPHNFYGHLCTMMNAHFAACVPNLRIMETDLDRLEWQRELFRRELLSSGDQLRAGRVEAGDESVKVQYGDATAEVDYLVIASPVGPYFTNGFQPLSSIT